MMRRPMVARTASRLATGVVGRRGAAGGLPEWAATHSVDLPGVSETIDVTGAEQPYTTDPSGSWGAWVKSDAISQGWTWALHDGVSATNGQIAAYVTEIAGVGYARSYARDGAGALDVDDATISTTGIAVTAWRHIIVTHSSSGECRIYIDGVEMGDAPAATWGDYTALSTADIGSRGYGGFIDGHILEWWSAPAHYVTADEALAAYHAGVPLDARTVTGLGPAIADYVTMSNGRDDGGTLRFANIGASPNFVDGTGVNLAVGDLSTDTP